MDLNQLPVLPSIEQETLPNLPRNGISHNSETSLQSTRDYASLHAASTIPLPPSSPVNSSQGTPRLRMEFPSPKSRSPIQSPRPSRPLNLDRRSSTPVQTIRKSPSNQYMSSAKTTPRPSTVRGASSNFVPSPLASTPNSRSSSGTTMKEMEAKPTLTASSLARDYFRKELRSHESLGTTSKTVVILRDSCYGHRYSRPRTSRAALSTIVERPERILACVLGASAAYVHIGRRHADGAFPPHPDRDLPPPPFKIRKTTRSIPLNYSAVTQVHGQRWMEELQIMCDSAEGKLAINGRELVRPIGYGKDEAGNPLPKLHEGDLYLCSESHDALQGCLGGVCEAVDIVFGPEEINRAFVCIRPPGHHCSSDFPSGFCWLNNVHVGIAHAAMTQGLTHAAIIDFDLHHGDGSQAIAWDHNRKAAGSLPKNASPYSKAPIGYFSLHDINSYPCEWGDDEKIKNASLCVENAHGQSVWNVHLEPWKNPTDFWRLYESRYIILLEKARLFLRHHTTKLATTSNGTKAKAAIFLSAGFDASEWEGAGMQRHKVNVPTDFYARFTSDVVKLADEQGLGVDGRVISVLEGGYSDRALTSGVLSHLCGLTDQSGDVNVQAANPGGSLASAMAKQLGMLNTSQTPNSDNSIKKAMAGLAYNPEWWTSQYLEALESLVNPAPESHAKPKDKLASNYSSPTQAFTAKITDLARERRSVSGQAEIRASLDPEPIQPPPKVDWTVASYELSRLLIPSDRQTLSCRHDELNAEATKVRRERQSAVGLPLNDVQTAVDQRMQLRDRKAKIPVHAEMVDVASRADRRRTIAAVADLPDQGSVHNGSSVVTAGIAKNRPRRRSSAGSSILSAFESMDLNGQGSQTSEPNGSRSRGKILPHHNEVNMPKVSAKMSKVPVQRKFKQAPAIKPQPTKPKTSPQGLVVEPDASMLPSIPRNASSDASNHGPGTESKERRLAAESIKSAGSGVGADDDLDAISSGMRTMKINLKVPSPEEHASREKKAAEEKDKVKKARAAKKAAIPRATKIAAAKKDQTAPDTVLIPSSTIPEKAKIGKLNDDAVDLVSSLMVPQQLPESGQTSDQRASAKEYVPILEIAHAEPPLQPTIPAPVPAPVQTEKVILNGTVFQEPRYDLDMLVQEDGQVSSITMGSRVGSPRLSSPDQPSDSSYLPRSAITASAPTTIKKTRADLPRFTASSPIPFARVEANVSSAQLAKGDADSARPNADSAAALSNLDSQQRQLKEKDVSEMEIPFNDPIITPADPLIWEVPETPRR